MSTSWLLKPISLDECVQLLLTANPEADAEQLEASLKQAVAQKKSGVRCHCGRPMWAVGSALTGYPMCFTCITGQSMPDEDDYEIDEVYP